MISARTRFTGVATTVMAICLAAGTLTPVQAQTIRGTLMEVETDQPISLGLVIMMTEAGDSITSGVTDSQGRFSVTAPDPGSFILVASAFGFKETPAGLFELGADGEMDVEFRVAPAPMPIEGMLVSLQRPVLQHNLIRNGYVRRLTRGLGHFITPAMIEENAGRGTADLFRGIPGVHLSSGERGAAFQGEVMRFSGGGQFCTPTIYIDGIRMSLDMTANISMDNLVPIEAVEAVEIYRRPAEIPVEYGSTASSGGGGPCGVAIIWTKTR
jgi:hypothetical protein